MSTINQLIKKSQAEVFRRAYIKRRANTTTGSYEADWQDITNYVKKWGTIKYEMEDEQVGNFKLSGINLTMRNDDGKFNPKSDGSSIWNGYVSEYKTKFKIEAGYIDTDGSELPTVPSLFIGVLTDDITINSKNEVNFKVQSLMSVFDDVPANLLSLTSSETAGGVVTKIKNLVDGNAVSIFGLYFSATAWDIQTTTSIYTRFATTTAYGDKSCWELIQDLAKAEGFSPWVDPNGVFHFTDKDTLTTTAEINFSGLGTRDVTYGHNIKEIESIKVGFTKAYTRIRVQINEADTATSFVSSQETWNVGDSSTSFLYGQRTYDVKNFWLDTATAQTLADSLRTSMSQVKRDVRIRTKFMPHISTLDRSTINYYQSSENNPTPTLWGGFMWGIGLWRGIGFADQSFKINGTFGVRSVEHDIDKFESKFFIREV